MDELFEAERKNLTQEPLNPIKASSSLTLTFEKGKTKLEIVSFNSLTIQKYKIDFFLSFGLITIFLLKYCN